jgi:hypothetical protein
MLASVHGQYNDVVAVKAEVYGVGNRFRIARRVSPRTSRNCIGLSAIRSIVSSSATRNSAPSPSRRPSYQSRVSSASASASGLKLTRRLTLDPAASGGLHPRELRTQAAERGPSSADPAPQPRRASTRARPHVGFQKGFPTKPSRARRVRQLGVSAVPKVKETSLIASIRQRFRSVRPANNVQGNGRRLTPLGSVVRTTSCTLCACLLATTTALTGPACLLTICP